MQTNQPPPLTRQRIDAFHASALRWLGWLMRLILTLGTPGRGKRIRRFLTRIELEVECILFCEALLRYGPPPRRKRHPRPAPTGYRRTRHHRLALFFKRAGVRARGQNALARVLRLFEVLAKPERFVAYFLKRLAKGLRISALVAACPSAEALALGASAPAAFADSS
jgi:hypothetical protein